jgi:hypothetical protein
MKSTEKRGKDDLCSSSIAVAVALMLAFLLSIPMLNLITTIFISFTYYQNTLLAMA